MICWHKINVTNGRLEALLNRQITHSKFLFGKQTREKDLLPRWSNNDNTKINILTGNPTIQTSYMLLLTILTTSNMVFSDSSSCCWHILSSFVYFNISWYTNIKMFNPYPAGTKIDKPLLPVQSQASLHICAVWPDSILLADQLSSHHTFKS